MRSKRNWSDVATSHTGGGELVHPLKQKWCHEFYAYNTFAVSTILTVLSLVISPNSQAAGKKLAESGSNNEMTTHVRLCAWLFSGWGGGGYGFGSDGYVWPIVGGSTGVEILDFYIVEGGGSLLFGLADDHPFELFLRGGIELDLLDARDSSGAGWRLRLIVLVGYRYIRFTAEGDAIYTSEGNHCVAMNTGFEVMRHSSSGSGVGLRLLLGGSLPFLRHESGWTGEPFNNSITEFILDSYLALALAF